MSSEEEQKTIQLETMVQRNNELLASSIGDEVVMMSIENSAYYGLDPIGSKIWEMITEPRQVSDLCEQLMEQFEVSEQECQRDVLNFLNQMLEENMLVVE
jgi:hypothetical protein